MSATEKNKYDLDTPCLVLDLDILEQNLQKMQTAVKNAGKNIRPHIKTHKCSALAKKQIEYGAIGVCAAKVSEAEVLVNSGFKNILITGPVVTAKKIERLINLLTKSPSLMVVVDNASNITLLNSELGAKKMSIGVLLDLDVGLHRTGVDPSKVMALSEKIISSSNLVLRGIQAYAGHIQHIGSYEERKKASIKCLQEAVRIFHELNALIPSCKIFSASGTGTFEIDTAVPEISEFQVGSYVCMDAEYLGIEQNNKGKFEPALRLLTTVISNNQKGFVTVDAGLKTLYKDGGIPEVLVPENSGLKYDWFGDEYGMISHTDNSKLPQIGTVLELITSHCDPTINLFDKYFLTRGQKVVGTWSIDLRGCSQ